MRRSIFELCMIGQRAAEPGLLHFIPFDRGEIRDIPELVRKMHKDSWPIYGYAELLWRLL